MTQSEGRPLFPLPITIDAIDCEWLTTALRANAPDVTVRDVEVVDIVHATSTSVRLRLDMDEAGKQAGIPETVFVKGGFQEHSRELAFMHKIETLGYRDLLPTGELNSPRCYFADWDEESLQGIVIMEDLQRRGGNFGDIRVTRSREEVAWGLSLLAHYHARTWDCTEFPPDHEYGWVLTGGPLKTSAYRDVLKPEGFRKFMELPRAAAASTYFQDLDWIIETLNKIELLSERVPNCIIHGDANPGNIFFEEDGKPAFFDIVPRRMPAMYEAAYHIALSLDPIDRPRCERDLVRHYLDALRKYGINPPDFEDAMFQYGVFLADALIMSFFNPPGIVPEGRIVAVVARESAAMVDHNTIELLRSIT